MSPSAKTTRPSSTTAKAKDSSRSTAKTIAPAVEPSMRFHHTTALRTRTESLLNAIDTQPDQRVHGDALAELVAELVEAGMDFYFLRGLKMANVGFITEQSARLGMSGAVKLINSVSRKFIVRMDGAQLQAVAAHIRSLA